MPLLEVRNLKVEFHGEGGIVRAVDGVSFGVEPARTLGIVGESGCGKSVTAMSILRLVPSPPGFITAGEILYQGSDLLRLPAKEMPRIRGREIGMIFQDPMTALNPVFTIRRIMGEVATRTVGVRGPELEERLLAALREVGISDPARRLGNYPHELSGGMRQRILIAMALLHRPKLLIADEPTTALDVTIQKQILQLIKEMQQKDQMAVMLITHDLGVIAETCDDVAVMYAGRVVEQADVYTLFDRPSHPYTVGLMSSIPSRGVTKETPLRTIEGTVPSMVNPPAGCRFAPRCERRQPRCLEEDPALRQLGEGHAVACHFPVQREANP